MSNFGGLGRVFEKKYTKNGKEYSCWVSEISRFNAEGKRVRYAKTAKTEKEAKEKLKELITLHSNQKLVKSHTTLLKLYVDYFLNTYKKPPIIRQTTFDKYNTMAKHIYNSPIGDIQLQKLTTNAVQKFINMKAEKLSSKSVIEIHLILSMTLNKAIAEGLLLKNVAKRGLVALPKMITRKIEPLSSSDFNP